MSRVHTPSSSLESLHSADRPAPHSPARALWRSLPAAIVLVAGAAACAYFGWLRPAKVQQTWAYVQRALARPPAAQPGPVPPAAREPWDGLVTLGARGRTSMG